MKDLKKSILEIVFGALLLGVGVLIVIFFEDFPPRYIGGSIIISFGAILITSGIIGCAKK